MGKEVNVFLIVHVSWMHGCYMSMDARRAAVAAVPHARHPGARTQPRAGTIARRGAGDSSVKKVELTRTPQ
jgi:hypothetical protein